MGGLPRADTDAAAGSDANGLNQSRGWGFAYVADHGGADSDFDTMRDLIFTDHDVLAPLRPPDGRGRDPVHRLWCDG